MLLPESFEDVFCGRWKSASFFTVLSCFDNLILGRQNLPISLLLSLSLSFPLPIFVKILLDVFLYLSLSFSIFLCLSLCQSQWIIFVSFFLFSSFVFVFFWKSFYFIIFSMCFSIFNVSFYFQCIFLFSSVLPNILLYMFSLFSYMCLSIT